MNSEKPTSAPLPFHETTFLLMLTAFLPHLLMRSLNLALLPETVNFSAAPLANFARGFASDITITFALGILLAGFLHRLRSARGRWTIIGVSSAFWSLFAACNNEHIKVNFANINFSFTRYGLTKEFVTGSFLIGSILWKTLLCLAVTLGALYLTRKSRGLRVLSTLASILAGISFIALFLISTDILLPQWMQTNFLEDNLRQLRGTRQAKFKEVAIDETLKAKFFHADLNGELRTAIDGRKLNVLLILVEGLSKVHFEEGRFPLLRKRADHALYYPNFVSDQKHTNRGLFAITCGDYGNLATREAKSDLMITYALGIDCLPKILRDDGYATAFLQGASLGFMRKDRFGKNAGFSMIMGSESFEGPEGSSGWGVDDRILFRGVYNKVAELRQKRKPWFMTVLTSGTHHPYNVPASERTESGETTLREAQIYGDQALDELLQKLDADGSLKETVVLITGDEATPDSSGSTVSDQLHSNQSTLIAVLPGGAAEKIEEVFANSDILLSVCDVLGCSHKARIGRSIFRKYASPQPLLFTNASTDRVFLWEPETKNLLVCDFEFSSCSSLAGSIFAVDELKPLAAADTAAVGRLRSLVTYNDMTSARLENPVLFRERFNRYRGRTFLLGNFKSQPVAGDRLFWALQLKSAWGNSSPAAVLIEAYVPSANNLSSRFLMREVIQLAPGQVLNFRRSHVVTPAEPVIWSNIELVGPPENEVFVQRAAIKLQRLPFDEEKFTDTKVILGEIDPGPIDLLATALLPSCAQTVMTSNAGLFTTESCPHDETLVNPYAFTLPRGKKVQVAYDVEILSGSAGFVAGVLDGKEVVEFEKSKPTSAGSNLHLSVNYQTKTADAQILTQLVIYTATKDLKFKIRSAQLKVD